LGAEAGDEAPDLVVGGILLTRVAVCLRRCEEEEEEEGKARRKKRKKSVDGKGG